MSVYSNGSSSAKSGKRTATKIGAALLLALAVSACGSGSNSNQSTKAGEANPAGKAAAKIDFAARGSNKAWSLPNADIHNTRSITRRTTTKSVASLKPG